jgi:beta-phosphoglucomutase-like phosphatase (HAD superfamily)
MRKLSLDYILFDFDGVIVDSEILATKAILEVLKPFGCEMNELEYSQRFSGMMEYEVFKVLQHELDIDDVQACTTAYKKLFWSRYDTDFHCISGMHELVANLQIPASVVSNSNINYLQKSVTKVGLLTSFEQLFSAQMVERPKPSPDLYNYAAAQLELDRGTSIVVEDSPTGVKAAKEAGFEVIGFLGAGHIFDGHHDLLMDNGADFIARNAQELRAILN